MDINPEHFKLVIERWQKKLGKSSLSIFDFPLFYSVSFSEQGKSSLHKIYSLFEDKFGIDAFYRKTGINLYCIRYYLQNKSKSLSIEFLTKLKKIANDYFPDYDCDLLETEVNFIYCYSYSENYLKTSFPLNLENQFFAYLVGLSFDSFLKKYCFVNSNPELILKAKLMFEALGFNCKISDSKSGQQIRLGVIATELLHLSGFTIQKQIKANNPLPEWIVYSNNKPFLFALLAAIVDAEGNIYKRSIRICQNTFHKEIDSSIFGYTNFPQLKVSNTSYIYNFPVEKRKIILPQILENPPLLLVSIQILLNRLGIDSKLYSVKVYVKKSGEICSAWHLAIFSQKNLELFYDLTKEHLLKKSALEKIIKNYKRQYVSKPGKRVEDFIQLVKSSGKSVFTSNDLIEASVRKRKTVINLISSMKSKGIIKQVNINGKRKEWQLMELEAIN